ncbi:hypothetical protein LT679_07890 [Mucilaginibacter roseus]|uniref:Uncharacterized protein n=1 Tax=Mucilaginibacter roseus TaxID=1528868 RepID=A0ABS8U382_9SPHI|nr:hypothetical protein [Mucilaginibacter roseus]MCD8740520.1 hypothetical protein [Mucilaginibacter roseus]
MAQQVPKRASFEDTIKFIEHEVVDLTAIGELFRVNAFVEIYKQPDLYQDSVLTFLKQHHTYQQNVIAACSMIGLPREQYLSLLLSYYDLYNHGYINEELLEDIVVNPADSRYKFISNYNSDKTKQLALLIQKDKRLSKKFKKEMAKIASGKIYKDLKGGGFIPD